jgi:hypothetical protein
MWNPAHYYESTSVILRNYESRLHRDGVGLSEILRLRLRMTKGGFAPVGCTMPNA